MLNDPGSNGSLEASMKRDVVGSADSLTSMQAVSGENILLVLTGQHWIVGNGL